MAALTAAQHPGLFMFLWIIGSLAAGESLKTKENQEVKAKPGEDVTLQCNTSTDAAITLLEWSRPELENEYVFYFRENKLFESFQIPRYRGRVELKDPEMKNGDFSVHLKNVSKEDLGIYECRVITSLTRWKRAAGGKLVASLHLVFSEGPEKHLKNGDHQYGDANDEQPGGPRGHVGLGVGLVCLIVGVGVGVAVGLVVKSKRAQLNRPSERVDVKLNPRHVPELFTPDCHLLLN